MVSILAYNGTSIHTNIRGRCAGSLALNSTLPATVSFTENNFVLNNFPLDFSSVINEVPKMINILKIALLLKNLLTKFIIYRKWLIIPYSTGRCILNQVVVFDSWVIYLSLWKMVKTWLGEWGFILHLINQEELIEQILIQSSRVSTISDKGRHFKIGTKLLW